MTIFPEVVTEGKVDFEKLKQLLGEYVDDSNERYNFTLTVKGEPCVYPKHLHWER